MIERGTNDTRTGVWRARGGVAATDGGRGSRRKRDRERERERETDRAARHFDLEKRRARLGNRSRAPVSFTEQLCERGGRLTCECHTAPILSCRSNSDSRRGGKRTTTTTKHCTCNTRTNFKATFRGVLYPFPTAGSATVLPSNCSRSRSLLFFRRSPH